MTDKMEEKDIVEDIGNLKGLWTQRDTKFREWYDILNLTDKYAKPQLESSVSNEPRTFYNMSLYLLTAGALRHTIPVASDSWAELDKQARVERACAYMWRLLDEERQRGGSPPFIQELGFHLLVLGWYSVVAYFDKETSLLKIEPWAPSTVFPRYADRQLTACVHSYALPMRDAIRKATIKGWKYAPAVVSKTQMVTIDDYFYLDEANKLQNMVLIDKKDVTGLQPRDDMKLLVSPVGGFPDQGLINPGSIWQGMIGQSILETNRIDYDTRNKWDTFEAQILRDTAETRWQETSVGPQVATPEQLRVRGGVFSYQPGEGIAPITPSPIPLEMTAKRMELGRRIQKGSFSDAVYGMADTQMPGYTLSQLSSSSANQILYPYMTAKHFVVSEYDRFWLLNLKNTSKVFEIKGRLIEELENDDIPEEAAITVESEIATQKDWLERATIANMLKDHLDEDTIRDQILKMPDTQEVRRRKSLQDILEHPLAKQVEMIAAFTAHAEYLTARGDRPQAQLFLQAAQALQAQMAAPQPGQGAPAEQGRIEAAREAGAPEARPRVPSSVMPPEARGFTPQELRQSIGKGKITKK